MAKPPDSPLRPDASAQDKGTIGGPPVDEVVARLDDFWRVERLAAQTQSEPFGRCIGKYLITRVLGRGSFGVVYQANDTQLVRTVALKLPRPEVMFDAESLGRFENEALAAATLDHPAIVTLLEADLDAPTPYIASTFCPGPDLAAWLAKQDAQVPASEAAGFMAQLADAVHYAHQRGVFHRDLKPSNVLLEPLDAQASGDTLAEFRPRLTDFGLAKLVEASLHDTRSSLLVGSPLYMAPEQLDPNQETSGGSVDVYALGVILFELLTKRTPAQGGTYIEVVDDLRKRPAAPLRSIAPELPVDLDTICGKCLAHDPRERYQSAGELQEDLERFVAGQPLLTRPWSWRDRLRRWLCRPERLAQAGVFTVLFQVLGAIWMVLAIAADLWLGVLANGLSTATALQASSIAIGGNLPLALLGWRAGRGSRWAFWPVLAMSAGLFAFTCYSSAVSTDLFAEFYPTQHSKVAAYTGLVMGSGIQTALWLIAIPAWLRSRPLRARSSD